jgi:hypothetical protein
MKPNIIIINSFKESVKSCAEKMAPALGRDLATREEVIAEAN